VRAALERMGLRGFFRAEVTAEDGMETLAQRLLSAAIKLGRPPDHCVVFETSPVGVCAAHNCTMKARGGPAGEQGCAGEQPPAASPAWVEGMRDRSQPGSRACVTVRSLACPSAAGRCEGPKARCTTCASAVLAAGQLAWQRPPGPGRSRRGTSRLQTLVPAAATFTHLQPSRARAAGGGGAGRAPGVPPEAGRPDLLQPGGPFHHQRAPAVRRARRGVHGAEAAGRRAAAALPADHQCGVRVEAASAWLSCRSMTGAWVPYQPLLAAGPGAQCIAFGVMLSDTRIAYACAGPRWESFGGACLAPPAAPSSLGVAVHSPSWSVAVLFCGSRALFCLLGAPSVLYLFGVAMACVSGLVYLLAHGTLV